MILVLSRTQADCLTQVLYCGLLLISWLLHLMYSNVSLSCSVSCLFCTMLALHLHTAYLEASGCQSDGMSGLIGRPGGLACFTGQSLAECSIDMQ